MLANGCDLSMIRGDSETVVILQEQEDGTPVPFEPGDVVRLTIKTSPFVREVVKQWTVTEFAQGQAVVEIRHEDTKSLRVWHYYYDVQLTARDGQVTTLIPPSIFRIGPEVTYD